VSPTKSSRLRTAARVSLGAFLILAGLSHLLWSRNAFHAQVPGWLLIDPDTVVLFSGVVEIVIGSALIGLRTKWTGWIAAAFFVAIFPGNIAQFVNHRDAFGLDTDTRRGVRLLFQPLLVAWALYSAQDRKATIS
jgi:uncharacterized membrane protein